MPRKKLTESGFTLLEVMVSMLIFATGMLGVAYQMSQGIKATINTKVHSSVMQVASQSIEPLNKAVLLGNDEFAAALATLNTDEGLSAPFADSSNQGKFTVSLDSAINIKNQSLFSVATDGNGNVISNWKPPYTVVLKITYPIADSNKPLTFYTTHVISPNS